MTLKNKLEQLNNAWTQLAEKVKAKLTQNQSALNETTTKLNETNHKLELLSKENSENEKTLETLLKEFNQLTEQLD